MMIKTLKFLFVSLIIFSLSSCGDDDMSSPDPLIGTWKAESFNFTVESTSTVSGTETTVSTVGEGSNLDYELEFTESTFATSGGYSYSISSELDGMVISSTDETVSNVSGSGTYSTSGDLMTIDGSFFEFTFNGADLSSIQGAQTVNFEIQSDNTLIFTQNEQSTTTTQGVTVTSNVVSTSTWKKQ